MPLANARDLTDAQWDILGELIPEPITRKDGRGRPWKARRAVLKGVLWVLRTDGPWADVPDRYPSYQTCHRRFQQWVRSGVMKGVLEALALDLKSSGALCRGSLHRWELRTRQERGTKVGKTKRGKGTKTMAVADRHGLPVAVCVESATPHEVKLATTTLSR
jgi:transposase